MNFFFSIFFLILICVFIVHLLCHRTSCVRWKMRTLFSDTRAWKSSDFRHKVQQECHCYRLACLNRCAKRLRPKCSPCFLTLVQTASFHQMHFQNVAWMSFAIERSTVVQLDNCPAAPWQCLLKNENVSSSLFSLSLVMPLYFAQKSTSLVNKVGLLWVCPLRLLSLFLHIGNKKSPLPSWCYIV